MHSACGIIIVCTAQNKNLLLISTSIVDGYVKRFMLHHHYLFSFLHLSQQIILPSLIEPKHLQPRELFSFINTYKLGATLAKAQLRTKKKNSSKLLF